MERLMAALSTLRPPSVIDEYGLHELIGQALTQGGISFVREAPLGPRCRVDFLCEGGIAVEVKRGYPARAPLMRQLGRYAACGQVSALVLVVERNASVPARIAGKPCVLFGLNRLWGVAL